MDLSVKTLRPQQWRQQERQKTIACNEHHNDSARVLSILVYFFPVLYKTVMWSDQISSFMESMSTQGS